MGFGNISTHLIIFIAVMSISAGTVVLMKGFVDSTADSLNQQQSLLSEKLETDITIEVINYDNTTNHTYVYVRNTGSTRQDISKVDIYFNHLRLPRLEINRSIEVLEDTDTKNIGTWDPGEEILIRTNTSINQTRTYTVTVSTYQGITDEDEFSI